MCLVWDFAMGEEGLTGVLDSDFSCCICLMIRGIAQPMLSTISKNRI